VKAVTNNKTESLLVSVEDAAKLLGIGKTHFYGLHSSGRLGPLPIKLGSRSLWNRQELTEWVSANCPARQQWQQIKGNIGSEKN
jgi:excisionase family DNA binding protein